jgi:uncharacterized SAM-binding protein YcdF (DUF218 family)
MLFVVKKWIEMFLTPIPLCFLLMVLGLILMNLHRRCIRLGHVVILLAGFLLISLATPSVSAWLLAPLEDYYPAFTPTDTPVDYVIVLGGGQVMNSKLPIYKQVNATGKARMDEGLRIMHMYPHATLLVTGCCERYKISGAEIYARYAEYAGISRARIRTFAQVQDTDDESKLLAPIIAGHRTVLVTSASHMRRAMQLFTDQNSTPIPAPTYYLAQRPEFTTLYEDFPSSRYLYHSQVALHEWFGLLWGKIRN